MSAVKPNIGVATASLSSPLITPGWPLASVQQSNPVAAVENKEVKTTPASAHQSAARATALTQSGHTSDGVDR